MKHPALALFSLLLLTVTVHSQTVPLDSARWDIPKDSKFEEHLGRPSLFLLGGLALVKDSQFIDGIIEFDMASGPERGFQGVVWRVQDFENYEEFYIRPHQSGNPDANQYQPVFNGVDAWQLYYGASYSAPVKYDFNQWTHFKLVISGKNADIYIKDMETPALFISDLKRDPKQGRVGLRVTNFAPAWFSNFSFTPATNPTLKGKAQPPEPAPAGTVMSWQVSSAFDGKTLEKKYRLAASDKQNFTWNKIGCEAGGIFNLARLTGVQPTKNTVFARLIIQSDREQVKKVRFGFSDEVKAFFNDQLIYGGSDRFSSRDYRFLGTVGLYDELYLPLRKGDNELWLAITEGFGGWGMKAVIEDREGMTIKE